MRLRIGARSHFIDQRIKSERRAMASNTSRSSWLRPATNVQRPLAFCGRRLAQASCVRRCCGAQAFINAGAWVASAALLGSMSNSFEIMAAIEAPCGKGMDDSDKRHIRPSGQCISEARRGDRPKALRRAIR